MLFTGIIKLDPLLIPNMSSICISLAALDCFTEYRLVVHLTVCIWLGLFHASLSLFLSLSLSRSRACPTGWYCWLVGLATKCGHFHLRRLQSVFMAYLPHTPCHPNLPPPPPSPLPRCDLQLASSAGSTCGLKNMFNHIVDTRTHTRTHTLAHSSAAHVCVSVCAALFMPFNDPCEAALRIRYLCVYALPHVTYTQRGQMLSTHRRKY